MSCWIFFPFFLLSFFGPGAFSSEEEDAGSATLVPGCSTCGDDRCPEDAKLCSFGSVSDPCGCCPGGVCGRIDGEACWNDSFAQLPRKGRNNGFCAPQYQCLLRADLHKTDEPEAICVCIEQTSACGNNNESYPTPCALREEAMRTKNSTLELRHLGPCQSRPWIPSPPMDVASYSGQRIALTCEVKGFPLPDVSWEFHSVDGQMNVKLPSDQHDAEVNTSIGPENHMRTSSMQLSRLGRRHVGTYYCIASNSNGKSSSAAYVSMLRS